MKKTTWIIFILYFGLFVALGAIFYFKYLNKFFKSGAEPMTVEQISSGSFIYYNIDNNLYRLWPVWTIDPQAGDRIERFQSTGEVNSIDVSSNDDLVVYDAKTVNGSTEIWQVKTPSNESANLAFIGQKGLDEFQNFTKPKISPSGEEIAFIGVGNSDHIITFSTAKGFTIQTSKFASKIADFAWTDTQAIVFCTQNMPKNACYKIDIASGTDQKILEADVLQIAAAETGFVYLAKENETANIYYQNLTNGKNRKLSDLQSPKKVDSFSLDKNQQKLAFKVSEGSNSYFYFENVDGSNRFELSGDGKNIMPLISPDGLQIAYLRPTDGIYIENLDNQTIQKIANLSSTNVKLLLWR